MLDRIATTEPFIEEEHGDEPPSNHSANPTFASVVAARLDRRGILATPATSTSTSM